MVTSQTPERLQVANLGSLFSAVAAENRVQLPLGFFILLRGRIGVIQGHMSINHTLDGTATEQVGSVCASKQTI